jgi:hypothetical protein
VEVVGVVGVADVVTGSDDATDGGAVSVAHDARTPTATNATDNGRRRRTATGTGTGVRSWRRLRSAVRVHARAH